MTVPAIGCTVCQRPLFRGEYPSGGCGPCVRSLLARMKKLFALGSIARPNDYGLNVRIYPRLQPHLAGRV